MSIKQKYKVTPCSRNEIRDFVEKWHYSKSINGVIADYCFKMEAGEEIIGAVIFGRLAMASQWKKYAGCESKVMELRRLVCVNDTEKNAESYMIGKCLRWLQLNTPLEVIVSYADPEYGHSGVIYKAANFKLIGQTAKGKVIYWNGKKYHDKTIRTKYKGVLKPFAVKIKQALEKGEAEYKKTVGKNIYVYNLRQTVHEGV